MTFWLTRSDIVECDCEVGTCLVFRNVYPFLLLRLSGMRDGFVAAVVGQEGWFCCDGRRTGGMVLLRRLWNKTVGVAGLSDIKIRSNI
jgi:hypothetical protein